MAKTFVETYLGCDIFFYTPPTVAYDQYGTPCLTTNYVTFTAVKKRICLSKGGTWDGSSCTLPDEPPEPPEGYCSKLGDTLVETYRGCPICYTTRILVGGVVGAYYSSCVEVYHHDIEDAKKDICEQQDGTWDGSTCTVEPPEPRLKHTALGIGLWPKAGTPPYDVTITAALVSGGRGLPDKEILLYKDEDHIDSGFTDESGIVEFTDTVTNTPFYRVVFISDGIYEAAESSKAWPGAPVKGLAGAAVLVLLYLIAEGGK